MSNYYRCDPLTGQQVVDYARMLRREHGAAERSPLNLAAILQLKTIPTRYGNKTFNCRRLPDEELEGDEAQTAITSDGIEFVVAESTYANARFGHGNARMVIALHLGHAVLHKNIVSNGQQEEAADGGVQH